MRFRRRRIGLALARKLGERAARELRIPVYLYERAATRPDRVNLADVRRGEFEGLRGEIATNPARRPDFGDAAVHPTAGATAVGARPFLVAFNVYLGPAANMPAAREVAKAVRHSTGGLRYVKALPLEVDGQAQISMSLVDLDGTPLYRAYEMVRTEAAAHGVAPTWSEIVGLVPERALLDAGAIGELSGYLAGFSGQAVIDRGDVYERIHPWVEKYGGWAILVLSAIPNPFFDFAGIAAGMTRMPVRTFLLLTWIGQRSKC